MTMRTIISAVFLLMFITFTNFTIAQDKDGNEQNRALEVRQLIESRNFTFVAQNANPLGGRMINLTSLYDVRFAGDTLISDLPYFGRAFVAPINPTESALRFTSTEYNYNIKERKKGGWNITVIPKSAKDVRQMLLMVTEKGYATMQVTSNNRQPISFSGYIKERSTRS